MALLLIDKLRSHAAARPDAVAVRQVVPREGLALTWRELARRVDALAAALRRELPGGAVVMLCSGNRPEYTVAFLGCLAAGMTVFPVAPDIAGPELLAAARRSNAGGMVTIGQAIPALREVFSSAGAFHELAPDAVLHSLPQWETPPGSGPALLLLSSGTTGRPKIVRRDGASLDAVSSAMADAIRFTAADRVLAAVPLCHSYGLEHGLLAPTWAGSGVHLCDGFDLLIAFSQLVGDQGVPGVTLFPGVPFMFEMLCSAGDSPGKLPTLRRAYSAGGPLPRSLFDAFSRKFATPVAQLYGATEIGSVTFNDPAIDPFDPASVGRPMAGVSIRIVDPQQPEIARPLDAGGEGHVAIRAASMLSGYLDGDDPPMQDGYFLTGDLGRVDTSGALTITGRIKLLIDVGGRKVNPIEVEEVLSRHPSVGACVVVPLLVSQTLSRLKAIVTPARAGEAPDVRALRQFARAHLSAYKVPRVFEVRESLPRSAAGKVLRQQVDN
ncbi:MAG: putative fatty-acid--CoA ligase [Phycisphaerales bacterium]|nr:putative fatty-acid--CoA ligase [Phycisphaerales bacterium]